MGVLYMVSLLVVHSLAKQPKLYESKIHGTRENVEIKLAGDLMIGGLFPIHEDGSPEGRHCGAIKLDKGIQRMEAMLYAVDEINKDPNLLRNIKLGVHILDTCHQDTHALEQTLTLVRESFAAEYSETHKCKDGQPAAGEIQPNPVVAVIGAASSQVSAMVSNVLRLFKIPQISYSSTSVELSDKSRFAYFSRVVPPDNFQARAMADVVKQLNWNFVSVVADEGSYGEPAYESFQLASAIKGICISTYEKIRRYFRDNDFHNLVSKLNEERSTGVVLFCHEENIRKILKAVSELNLINRFAWIGSDNWGTKRTVVANQESVSLGAITVQPKTSVDEGFNRYFTALNPECNYRNKWFAEFWEKQFSCSVVSAECRNLSLKTAHVQEDYVSSVIDAVYLLAHALDKLIADRCGPNGYRHCPSVKRIDGEMLLQYIRTVRFTGFNGEEITLDSRGDRKAKYNIYQYQGLNKSYVFVGEWKGRLNLNKTQIERGYPRGYIPKSTCSEPCKEDEFKTTLPGQCCWTCLPCNTEIAVMPNRSSCVACQVGYLPNREKNECVAMVPEHIEWNTWWAIVPASISTLGIVASLFVVYTFIRFNKTPVIKASGRELCYVMLCGIIACYLMTFPLLNPPNQITCGFLRLGIGISTCTIYASIFTKTLRMARIFNTEAQHLRSLRFLSPGAQILISCFLISIQAVTAFIWIMFEPPEVVVLYPDRLTAVLSCQGAKVMFPISMLYNILLIVLCTVYAFKTRKIPENFNETKYIGFTMYATCIVWLAFIPIYFGTRQNFKIQTITLCMCVSLCGTVALCCFFAPKLYIVLLQPDKNQVRVKNERFRTVQLMRDHVLNLQNNFMTTSGAEAWEETELEKTAPAHSCLLDQCNSREELSALTLIENGRQEVTNYKMSIASSQNTTGALLIQDEGMVEDMSNEVDSGVENSRASLVPKFDLPDGGNEIAQGVWLSPETASQFLQNLNDVTQQQGTIV